MDTATLEQSFRVRFETSGVAGVARFSESIKAGKSPLGHLQLPLRRARRARQEGFRNGLSARNHQGEVFKLNPAGDA